MSAKIITFANNKGGSAKTTTTTIVGHGITMMLEEVTQNNKVLVVDTDSQAHSTLLLAGRKNFEDNECLIDVLNAQRTRNESEEELRNVIRESEWHPNLHILPAAAGLDNVEEGLSGYDGNVFYLQRILRQVKDDYALILIDTCPKFSLLTKMALLASDEVMIPVAPQYLDADGLVNMVSRVNQIRNAWERRNPIVSGVIVVKLSNTVTADKEIRNGIKNHPQLGPMYLGHVPNNAEIKYAQAEKESIFTYNSDSSSARAYADVTRRIAQHLFAKKA